MLSMIVAHTSARAYAYARVFDRSNCKTTPGSYSGNLNRDHQP